MASEMINPCLAPNLRRGCIEDFIPWEKKLSPAQVLVKKYRITENTSLVHGNVQVSEIYGRTYRQAADWPFLHALQSRPTKLWLPRTKLLNNVPYTNFFFFPGNLSPTQVYYADYATPQHAQDSEARQNKPLSKPEFLEAAGESGRKTNHGFHSLKLTAMSQPNFHHIQIRSRLTYSRKTGKIGYTTKDSGWIQPPGQ